MPNFNVLPDGSKFMTDTNGGLLRIQNDRNTDQIVCYSHPIGFQISFPLMASEGDLEDCALAGTKTLREFGWVYIMENKHMPGLVKVGMSSRPPHHRVKELSDNTNCPEEFSLTWAAWTWHPREVERRTHAQLRRTRVSRKREFFTATPEVAESAIAESMIAVLQPKFIVDTVAADVDKYYNSDANVRLVNFLGEMVNLRAPWISVCGSDVEISTPDCLVLEKAKTVLAIKQEGGKKLKYYEYGADEKIKTT